jgi:hypothetical protein
LALSIESWQSFVSSPFLKSERTRTGAALFEVSPLLTEAGFAPLDPFDVTVTDAPLQPLKIRAELRRKREKLTGNFLFTRNMPARLCKCRALKRVLDFYGKSERYGDLVQFGPTK